MSDEELQRKLEPAGPIPFSQAVRVLTGFEVLRWNPGDPHCRAIYDKLSVGLHEAFLAMRESGIQSRRANEVGNKVELPVREALGKQGFAATVPQTRSGGRQSSGYPDILLELEDHPPSYLECKTYNVETAESPMRSFYCSPPLSKVTRNAYHLLVGFEMETRASVFYPVAYRLVPLENLPVGLKHELNSDNRTLYSACPRLLERRA